MTYRENDEIISEAPHEAHGDDGLEGCPVCDKEQAIESKAK